MSINDHLLLYILKSISHYIINEELDKAKILIFAQNYNNNKDEFFKIYEKEMILRCIKHNSKNNYLNEKEVIEFINNEMKYNTGVFKKCLFDMEISLSLTEDIKKISINNKSYKDIKYDLNKLDVFVGSNLIWNEKDDDIKIKDNNLKVYFEIFRKYYKRRFPKRLINFSNKNCFVIVSLNECNLKIPVEYYDILQFISKYSNFSLEVMQKEINMDIDKIQKILKHLKYKKIINSDFSLNMDTFNTKKNINLCKIENIDEEAVLEEIHFNRSHSTNCHIIKILKKEKSKKYEELFNAVCERVNNWFQLDKTLYDKCLKKLINRDLISKKDDFYTYII